MAIDTFTVTCDLSTYALAERGGGYGKLVVKATPGYMPVPADLTSLVQPDPVTIDTDGTASITLAAIPGVKYTISTSPRNLFTPFTFDALGAGVTKDLSELMPVPATSPTTPYVRGASAYEVAVADGFVGTAAQWLASLAVVITDNGDGTLTTNNGAIADNGNGTLSA